MAVLLTDNGRRARRVAARVAGLWYAVLLVGSAAITPADLETGAVGRWLGWGLHLGADHACVTCGLTRSFAAMSHGQWQLAADYNAAGPALYAAMVVLAAWSIASAIRALRAHTATSPM